MFSGKGGFMNKTERLEKIVEIVWKYENLSEEQKKKFEKWVSSHS